MNNRWHIYLLVLTLVPFIVYKVHEANLETTQTTTTTTDDKNNISSSRSNFNNVDIDNSIHTWMYCDTLDFDMDEFLIVNAFLLSQDKIPQLNVWLSGPIGENANDFQQSCKRCSTPNNNTGTQQQQQQQQQRVVFRYLNYSELIQRTPLSSHTFFANINPDTGLPYLPFALTSDVIRILLVYEFGGTWLDLDAWPMNDLSTLFVPPPPATTNNKEDNNSTGRKVVEVDDRNSSSNYQFVPSSTFKDSGFDKVNHHILHGKARSRLLERYIHTLALHPYDDESVWFSPSGRNVHNWIYNDGIWTHVGNHNSKKNDDNTISLIDMNIVDPIWHWNDKWKKADVTNWMYVYHSRYPKKKINSNYTPPLLEEILQYLGPPLQPTGKEENFSSFYKRNYH